MDKYRHTNIHTNMHKAVSHSLSVSPFPPLSPTDSRTHPTLTFVLMHTHTHRCTSRECVCMQICVNAS